MRKVPISGRDVFIRLNTVINLSMTVLACIAGACMELSNWTRKGTHFDIFSFALKIRRLLRRLFSNEIQAQAFSEHKAELSNHSPSVTND